MEKRLLLNNANPFFIVSCEHASCDIPAAYGVGIPPRHAPDHTAFDIGAEAYAKELAQALTAPLFCAKISRLLIDCNRSLSHPHVFGRALRAAPVPLKQQLIDNYYLPYRQKIENAIVQAQQESRPVVHLAAHSFTPVLKGVTRRADIGLLYDPQRQNEKHFALRWQAMLKHSAPHLRVRRNYPYRGVSDSLTTALRRRYDERDYLGFEIEINQALFDQAPRSIRKFRKWFVAITREVFTPSLLE